MSRGSRLPGTRAVTHDSSASGDTFLIVTEGEVTEPEYLEALRRHLGMHEGRVDVVQAAGTDAVTVVDEADSRKKDRAREARKATRAAVAYDQVWVVFDTERHDTNSKLLPALNRARDLKIFVALSNPSIEYWFLLHFKYTTRPFVQCDGVVKYLQQHGWQSYSKRRGENDYAPLMAKTASAIAGAKRCRVHAGQPVEKSDPSTCVDLLVQALNDSVPDNRRISLD